jgi:arylsulfatase
MRQRIKCFVVLSGVVSVALAMSMWLRALRAQQPASAPNAPQEVTGTPGSPGATTTINGQQLPPLPQKFGGKIERNAAESTPYWPERVVPPKGAPNVLLIMTDDTGFGVSSTFGGVIPTPNLDRIAANGLRYTNFNSTALCSPTVPRSSPAATTIPWASGLWPSNRPASLDTTAL